MKKTLLSAFAAVAASICTQPALADSLPTDVAKPTLSCQVIICDELVLIDGGHRTTMQYMIPQVLDGRRRFLGLVGNRRHFAVLLGTSANFRLPNLQPTFVLAAPRNAQPQSLVALSQLEVNPNGRRQVQISRNFVNMGVRRAVTLRFALAADQSSAPTDTTLYQLTPESPLAPGEYALIVSAGPRTGTTGQA